MHADDGHPLALWCRQPAHPHASILLVHGRTWSALPDFDLQVAGESRSVLAALAAHGYAACAIDLRGYGDTPRDSTGWNTPDRAVRDVSEVLQWITAHRRLPRRPVLLGWSYGSMVSQLTAQRHGDRISALILYGYPFDDSHTIPAGGEPAAPPRRPTTAADARSDFITPAVTSAKMESTYVVAALRADPVRTDWRHLEQWNALDPSRVHVRTLLLQGEHDPSVPHAVLARVFERLGTAHKTWITLMGGDHASLLEDTTPTFIDAVTGFLQR